MQLTLQGELDVSTTPMLVSAMDEAEAWDPSLVVIDLGGVTFIDGAGMTAVLAAARHAAGAGRRLRIERASAPIRRLFQLTAIDQSLEVLPGPA